MRTKNNPRYPFRLNSLVLVGVFLVAVTVLVVPFYSAQSSSAPAPGSSQPLAPVGAPAKLGQINTLLASTSAALAPSSILPLPVPGSFQETIETFAADCMTPRTSFVIGETVCAKTDNVDLNYPGGRWVHWLRPDLSIAHGGNGTTTITTNPQTFTYAPDTVGTWKATIAEQGDDSQTPAVFTVTELPTLATYALPGCTDPKTNFVVGDDVCAKAGGEFSEPMAIYWVNPDRAVVQIDTVDSENRSSSRFDVSTVGNWRVYLVAKSDGSARAVYGFTVSDPQQPQVDLSIIKVKNSGEVNSGSPISYEIVVTNNGPDTASSVQLTDAVPSNATYFSSSQDSGPTFTRTQETPVTTWVIASLTPGASARFTFIYTVNGAAGTVVSNTASITNSADELHPADNTSTASDTVSSGSGGTTCSLDCPNDITTTATTHGSGGGANVTYSAPEQVGTCGTVTTEPASGSFFPIGTTTVTSTSSTGDGFCSFTVTVVDSAAPTITCPANITVTANSGQSQAFVPNPNGSSSNVGSPTVTGDEPLEVTGSREDGEALTSAYPVGVTDITWIATDPSGRQATCTQSITVNPNQTLTITCPSNKTASSPNGCDPATVDPGQATSNSQTATITSERSDGQGLNDPYPVGTTTITWTATDTDSQSASCTQTVTVSGTDNEPPTLTVPPNVSATTSSCTATLDDELGVATAEDNCGSVSISRSGVPTFSCPTPQDPNRQCESFVFPTGTTIITYTATDSSGNSTTGTQSVTVTEDPPVNPTITAPGDVTLYTGPGATSCSVTVTDLDATLGTASANDNCPGVTVARSNVPAGNAFPLGNTTVTYTATDKSGNTAADTQVVTVVDNTAPVITCPADVTSCSFIVNPGTATATDNCDSSPTVTGTRSDSLPLIAPYPPGATTITWTATDDNNNQSSCTQTVTVGPAVTALGPANIWVGVKNSDSAGLRFDLKAEIYENDTLIGSGEVFNVPGGSSGFNNAIQNTIAIAQSQAASFCAGEQLKIKLWVRAGATGHVSGFARLWYNDAAANTRFDATVDGNTNTYYLLDGFVLGAAAGPGPKKTIDVFVHRNQNGNAYKVFGTWVKTF